MVWTLNGWFYYLRIETKKTKSDADVVVVGFLQSIGLMLLACVGGQIINDVVFLTLSLRQVLSSTKYP